jgi:hypothetical protein
MDRSNNKNEFDGRMTSSEVQKYIMNVYKL